MEIERQAFYDKNMSYSEITLARNLLEKIDSSIQKYEGLAKRFNWK